MCRDVVLSRVAMIVGGRDGRWFPAMGGLHLVSKPEVGKCSMHISWELPFTFMLTSPSLPKDTAPLSRASFRVTTWSGIPYCPTFGSAPGSAAAVLKRYVKNKNAKALKWPSRSRGHLQNHHFLTLSIHHCKSHKVLIYNS